MNLNLDKDVTLYLNEFKFGDEISGGIETILHRANIMMTKQNGDGCLATLILNF